MERVLLTYILVATLAAKGNSQVVGWNDDERLHLWSRGEFNLDVTEKDEYLDLLPFRRSGPISEVRNSVLRHQKSPNCDSNGYCWDQIRGGSQSVDYNKEMESKIQELGAHFGADFLAAIEQNKRDHKEDCKKSCEIYYCVAANTPIVPMEDILGQTTIKSYSMGPVPPEDFVSVKMVLKLAGFSHSELKCLLYFYSERLTASGKIFDFRHQQNGPPLPQLTLY
jgi:hypothetical protein